VATFTQWISGARPRTLPNAVAPVVAGTGAAAWLHSAVWGKALLALVVALALIVGVNYANDYRTASVAPTMSGPAAATGGSRLATPRSVLTAAVTSLTVGRWPGCTGVAQRAVADRCWRRLRCRCMAVHGRVQTLRLCGFWRGRGVRVLRLVAVLGTEYTQALRVDWVGWCWRSLSAPCRQRCW